MSDQVTEYSQFNTVSKFSFRWMSLKIYLLFFSLVLVLCSIFAIFNTGFNTSVDFKGGTLIEVGFSDTPNIVELRQILKDNNIDAVNVQIFGDKEIIVNLTANKNISTDEQATQIKNIFKQYFKDDAVFRRVETVGPKVGEALIKTSLNAVLFSIIIMLIYIWFRFEFPFAVGSVVATAHDILLTLGILSFFQIEFGLSIIAALLTIIGYSMNDTVVVYDRIRENLVKYRRAKILDIIDLSINETFTRTLVTSGTTLIALFALLFFGGTILRPFILTMIIGIFVGTYSSIFVAAPFLHFMNLRNRFTEKNNKAKNSVNRGSII